MGVDLFWNRVAAALHTDALPAVESKGKTVTKTGTSGAITADAGQPLFGQSTLHFVGEGNSAPGVQDGSALRIDTHADFNIGSGDWTLEGWALMDSGMVMSDTVNANVPHPMIERSNASFSAGSWSFHDAVYRIDIPPQTRVPKLEFWLADYSTTQYMLQYTPGVTHEGSWRHFAVVRAGDLWTMYIQGESVATITSALAVADPTGANLIIGNSIFNTDSLGLPTTPTTAGRSFTGNLAEWRITKGLARYTVNFANAFDAPGVGPGARFPDTLDTGDYSGSTFTGATGATGAAATVPGLDGEAGPDGRSGASGTLVLPLPSPAYDQRNETETRRAIELALRRG